MIRKSVSVVLAVFVVACQSAPKEDPAPEAPGVARIYDAKTGNALSFADLVGATRGARVVYLGEQHNNGHQHEFQLEMIRAMYAQTPDLAIGMEMFQRPFQAPLTEFVTGAIDEEEFLRRTEYFTRWGWDYRWYRPILLFAREHRIPVVALNAPREVNRKVSRSGLESLTDEERAGIAADIDLDIEAHREFVKSVWDQHPMGSMMTFENFYASQCVWEDTMAESVADALAADPNRRMAAVVGGGHVARGFGVPIRAARRGAEPFAILVGMSARGRVTSADLAEMTEDDPGDYLFVTAPAAARAPTPKLGVMLDRTDDGEGLLVQSVVRGSLAGLAGVAADDRIIGLNGQPVADLTDLKMRLTLDDVEISTIEVLRGEDRLTLTYDTRWAGR